MSPVEPRTFEPRTTAEALDATLPNASHEQLVRIRTAFLGALRQGDAVHLDACVRCGLCAESCHYARIDDDVRSLPAYKVDLVASVYRRECSWMGRAAPHWVGARDLDARTVHDWVDALFGRCTMCGRCMVNCAVGIDVPTLVRAARTGLAAGGLVPPELQAAVDRALSSGNNMGISRDEWVETVRWLEDELRAELDDPEVRMPLDEPGATFLYALNPREPKFFPLSLMAAAAIFHAAGEPWTLSSENYDVTNYGFFSGDDEAAGTIAHRLADAAHELGVGTIVLGECGHGFVSSRWLGPGWMNSVPDVTYRSIVEVVWDYIRDGRIVLDPARSPARVTLHDPCNLVRLGGIVEEPRRILIAAVADFVEMTPNREHNFCCGGGGGQLSMTRYAKRRLAAGRVKADQIRATGATVVASPCHNCIDQITELSKEYQLSVTARTLCEIVADAIVR